MHPLLFDLLRRIDALDALIDRAQLLELQHFRQRLEGLRREISTPAEQEAALAQRLPGWRADLESTARLVLQAMAATEQGRSLANSLLRSSGLLRSLAGDLHIASSLPGDQVSDPDPQDLPPRRPKG